MCKTSLPKLVKPLLAMKKAFSTSTRKTIPFAYWIAACKTWFGAMARLVRQYTSQNKGKCGIHRRTVRSVALREMSPRKDLVNCVQDNRCTLPWCSCTILRNVTTAAHDACLGYFLVSSLPIRTGKQTAQDVLEPKGLGMKENAESQLLECIVFMNGLHILFAYICIILHILASICFFWDGRRFMEWVYSYLMLFDVIWCYLQICTLN